MSSSKSRWILVIAAAIIAVSAAAGVTLLYLDRQHCDDIKRQGASMQREADAAASHGDYAGELELVENMGKLVRDNESCFTEAEIARTEMVLDIVKP